MRPYISFIIALTGFAGMGWAMYKRRFESGSVVPTVAFGLYALLFALGTAYYGDGILSSFKGGPGGIEVTVTQGKKEINNEKDQAIEAVKSEIGKQREIIAKLIVEADTTERSLKALIDKARPRILTQKQQEDLIGHLGRSGHFKIVVYYTAASDEPKRFASQLNSCLKLALWDAPNDVARLDGEVYDALALLVKDKAKPPPAASALQKALAAIGYFAPLVENPVKGEGAFGNDVVLLVGAKDYSPK